MQFKAHARYIPYSPYKLRPIVDVIRGKDMRYALAWCSANKNRRMMPVIKLLDSAFANASQGQAVAPERLVISKIIVDQGPMRRYFKPGAQGRAMPQRRRFCHISVEVQSKVERGA